MNKKRFVILDRDGTIIKHKHHLTDLNDVQLTPKSAEAIKKLKDLGMGIIIITNQSVVGRGLVSLSGLEVIHKKILHLLAEKGAHIDAIYFCPHRPEDNCSCRKPKLGLAQQASKDYGFDPKSCFVIGDNTADIEMGKKFQATTILVKTGYGEKVAEESLVKPNNIVADLMEAANTIEHYLK